MSELMDGFTFSVKAHRSRAAENVTVHLEAREPGSQAWFYLSRDEAYAFAEALAREASWLARLQPQPEKVA